jgi:hypothetical protein
MIFLLIWFVLTSLSLLFIRWVNKNKNIYDFKNSAGLLIIYSFIPVVGFISILLIYLSEAGTQHIDGNKIMKWFKGE